MDNSQKPTIVSFCTGYGGIERGLEFVFSGVTPIASVEIESYAITNLVTKMEKGYVLPHPIHTDVKTFQGEYFRGKVDILTGGYPCQPFSMAGKRLGKEDPRHLWPHIARQIKSMRPLWCFFENVEGHITEGLQDVIHDLGDLGYESTWGIFSASEVGAPHQRNRVFILAKLADPHSDDAQRNPRELQEKEGKERLQQWNHDSKLASSCSYGSKLAHSNSSGTHRRGSEQKHQNDRRGLQDLERRNQNRIRSQAEGFSYLDGKWPARPKQHQHDWEAPRVKPRLGRAVNGTPNRVDRLRLLGNGVVPQVAAHAFTTLIKDFT